MNKSELVKALADDASLTIKVSEKFLNSFISITEKTLKKGEDVSLVGFGSFCVIDRKERMGLNFQTKKPVKIPASKSVKFKAGKGLKDTVN